MKKTELYHYGVKGMKWGVRHDPEPKGNRKKNNNSKFKKRISKGKTAAGKQLKKNGNKKIDSKNVHERSVQDALKLSDAQMYRLKQTAKIAGIALGTSAGIFLACALMNNAKSKDIGKASDIVDSVKDTGTNSILQGGFNLDGSNKPYGLTDGLFNNKHNGDYIGDISKENGYGNVTADIISNSIRNIIPAAGRLDDRTYTEIVDHVCCEQRNPTFFWDPPDRRLSCWSASNAIFMSSLTGKDYISKNFQNLVDFNDFGQLYKEKPKIFDALGFSRSDFVGEWNTGSPGDTNTATSLVKSIFKNIGKNNLTTDGSRTIGFINAAYNSETCTHQWNFELKYLTNGWKELIIDDGYTGFRSSIAKLRHDGKVDYDSEGFGKFVENLGHYNQDSIRFYAPSLDSINPAMMAKIILGKN